MATAFQLMLADAAVSETRFMAELRRTGVYLMPLSLDRCSAHPHLELAKDFTGMFRCPHQAHWPDRGDGE
ncbi:hypothetical protein ABZ517_05600 [Streptomyces scabiei]|uniref:hypothetical protein n=1 Tax=Streptomyces scabiei TaxID=1930 RepID=UPI0033CB48DD